MRFMLISRHHFFIGFIFLALCAGIINSVTDLAQMQAKRKTTPYFFGGDLFAPIKGANNNERFIGYLTDRNIDTDAVSMRFTQAQFTLAPTILDFNNPQHHFLLLDFQDPKQAIAKAQELNARPLKLSPQGILFAERSSL
jgi:hypothetical protein